MNYPNYYQGYPQPVQYPQPMGQLEQLRQQAYQLQYQQPAVQQAPQMPQIPQMIWVKDYTDATNFSVPANTAVPLWDENRPYVYRREADSTGKSTTRIFQLVEVNEVPQVDAKFVTWDKFEALANSVTALANHIKTLPREMPVNE